jgi:hypothetical protein
MSLEQIYLGLGASLLAVTSYFIKSSFEKINKSLEKISDNLAEINKHMTLQTRINADVEREFTEVWFAIKEIKKKVN